MQVEADQHNSQSLTSELEELETRKQFARLRDKAYEYLARREHSRSELARKLSRFDQLEQKQDLLNELEKMGHQSDQRFAEQLARARVSAGKGPVLLQQEPGQHQIDSVIVETVMEGLSEQWRVLAEEVRCKKFGDVPPQDYKSWAKQSRFLQQRGFTSSQIPSFRD